MKLGTFFASLDDGSTHKAGRLAIPNAKREDIAFTADAYAKARPDMLGADAAAVSVPMIGTGGVITGGAQHP